ncbi:MAG: preprotein translocase subunit YajC [Phycisphaerales bacterium]|nr:preprotein translocase subunit YajC [Phycisphaerales bacterium]
MIEPQLVQLALTQGSASSPTALSPSEGEASSGATTTDPSGGGSAGQPGAPGAFGGDFMMILMLVIVAMILFSFMSQRKQKKRQQAMLAAVGKRAMVQTIGGIVGTVADVQGDRVVLVVHEGTNSRLTIARSAIQQVLEPQDQAQDAHEDEPSQDDLPEREDSTEGN